MDRSNAATSEARQGKSIGKLVARVALSVAAIALMGCGNTYRPVVTAISPVGPAQQTTEHMVILSDPGNGQAGVVSLVDVFGDTITGQANVGPHPSYLQVGATGDTYVLHCQNPNVTAVCDSSIDTFVSNATLRTQNVIGGSLVAGSNPQSLFSATGSIYFPQYGNAQVAVGTPGGATAPTLTQTLPTGTNPVYTFGLSTGTRFYTIATGGVTGTATATDFSATNVVVSSTIPLGVNPVYGIVSLDGRRGFVMNKGDQTISVINTQTNALDMATRSGAPRLNVGLLTSTDSNPLWADVATDLNELVVVNSGAAGAHGSIDVFNVQLCSVIAAASDPNCGSTSTGTVNLADSSNFGTRLANIPVGVNPVQVAVLQDEHKAYVANSDGTVSVVDLNSLTVVKTIQVGGSLNWIMAINGTPTGKIFVTASNTQNLTVINSQTDSVAATLPLQGNGIAIRFVNQ